MWVDRYRPRKLGGVVGNQTAVEQVRKWNWKKPLLLHGAPGVGKTAVARALSDEQGFDLVEVTNENIDDAVTISQTSSVFGNRKLILLDPVDLIDNAKKVVELVQVTRNPTMLITLDTKSTKLKGVSKFCEKIAFRRLHKSSIEKYLSDICGNEEIVAEKAALEHIAEISNGDMRSAINDLETIACGKKRITRKDLDVLGPRDRKADLYAVLSKIYTGTDFAEVVSSTYDLSEQPRDVLLWIDENVPRVFTNESLPEAFYYLARADVFLGRIMRRQYWGFLRYANSLMTAGVNSARPERVNYARYQFPGFIANLGRTKAGRSMRNSIGEKLSPQLHVSRRIVASQYVPLFSLLLKNKKITEEELQDRFKLTEDEMGYLRSP